MAFSMKTSCKKCGKDMEPSEMRALPDGSGFICKNCYENTNSPNKKPTLRKPMSSPTSPTSKINTEKGFFEKKEYICDACNYRFSRNSDFIVKTCPFCGKSGFVHQKIEQQANDLLQ